MVSIKRTSSDDFDFRHLVKLLDADLAIRDGKDHSFFSQYNKLDSIKHVVVAYFDNLPAGCGAIKQYDDETMEVKRMFVKPEFRGKGVARAVLTELEKWTAELGYSFCILETGKKQPEAISLYKTSGFELIPNYGQYEKVVTSVCMKKRVTH
ncbi:MAG: GNAT family N-acetyltransferase [Bacteroidetes bacterium]|nr:GNAT family N-acetyltransferase [Bacteroidota bacterium]